MLAQPKIDLAAFWMLVYGDIRINAYGFLTLETYVLGPEPILLPKRMMSDSLMPTH